MGPIAQSVEQRTFNPWVDGSSPSGPTYPRIAQKQTHLPIFRQVGLLLEGRTILEVRA